jgi:hypothetical protein
VLPVCYREELLHPAWFADSTAGDMRDTRIFAGDLLLLGVFSQREDECKGLIWNLNHHEILNTCGVTTNSENPLMCSSASVPYVKLQPEYPISAEPSRSSEDKVNLPWVSSNALYGPDH